MYQDSDLRISLYPYEYRGSHFDSTLDLPAEEDLDLFCQFPQETNDDQHPLTSDVLSLNLDNSMSDHQSYSEIDVDDPIKNSNVDFLPTGRILDDCPFLFRNTIKEMNQTLNTKLRNQFDEIHS
jgi:tRNA nucleotidyltransferase (CCA-adding enzyme)